MMLRPPPPDRWARFPFPAAPGLTSVSAMKPGPRITVTQTQRMTLTTSLAASINMLRADAAGLTRYLEEQAAMNPQLVLSYPEPQPYEWLPRWSQAFAAAGQDVQTVAAAGPSLMAHVLNAIEGQMITPQDRRIALALAEALEPSGWLGRSVAAVARDTGCDEARVAAVLRRLQRIEPVGLFARNLAECLRLQAEDAGIMDAAMSCMLDHLDVLAAGDIARLARICSVTEEQILRRLRLIRTLDPKPGAQFANGAAPMREPDLVAAKGAGGWTVSLNRSALPEVALSDVVQKGPQRSGARSIQRMVAARNATLLRVGVLILQRQERALENGLGALVPMTLADVAGEAGLHESTVSRVIAGAAVDTPRGTWWLRRLFSGEGSGGLSAAALRDRLARIISGEDATQPLSDEALALALSQDGALIARRTIAKYRMMLKIPPAYRRRKDKI
jgi:RNA polymerase sigma-54 factor